MKYTFNHGEGQFGYKCTDTCPKFSDVKIGSTFCQNYCEFQKNGMRFSDESLEYVICKHIKIK